MRPIHLLTLTIVNTFGQLFRLTTFGESHGPGIGGVIDGMPAGIEVDMDFLQRELDRRKPGQSALTTARKEGDRVELLSGVFEGRTTGCPIGFSCATRISTLLTMTTCAMCSAPLMLTSPINQSMAYATIAAADAPLLVKQSLA